MPVSSKQPPNTTGKIRLSFCGLQYLPDGTYMPLWTLFDTNDSRLPLNSTVSEKTLIQFGYLVPNPTGLKRGDVVNA